MKAIIFTVVLCMAMLLSSCGNQEQTADKSSDVSQTQSEGVLSKFSGTDLDGNAVNEEILKGYKLNMVNVWATFCGPCIDEMPELGELSQQYSDKGVQIVGIVSDVTDSDGSVNEEQLSLAKEIVGSASANYTHIIPGDDLYPVLYQITSVPTTFFVDENGKQIGQAYVGARDKESWQGIIEQVLEEVV